MGIVDQDGLKRKIIVLHATQAGTYAACNRRLHVLRRIMAGAICLTLVFAVEAQVQARQSVARTSGVITIGGTPHPYLAEGSGVPCIVIGLAPAYPPMFSERTKQHVRFIAIDFKNTWGAETPRNVGKIDLNTLVEEIDEARRALQLDKVCVVGHSTPGMLALEYAMRHADRASHVILIGVPPFNNRDSAKMRAAFWESDASADRKAVNQRLVERLPNDMLLSLSPRDAFAMRYVRNGPHYFYDASYDLSWAWLGRNFSAELLNRFFSLIAVDYDLRPKLAHNTVPTFLALGRYDYAVPYEMWNATKERMPHLTHHLFERSGHFVMIEEQSLFDDVLVRWLKAGK